MCTIDGENMLDDVVLDVVQAPPGRRLIGVDEAAATRERGLELDVRPDELRPEPRDPLLALAKAPLRRRRRRGLHAEATEEVGVRDVRVIFAIFRVLFAAVVMVMNQIHGCMKGRARSYVEEELKSVILVYIYLVLVYMCVVVVLINIGIIYLYTTFILTY